MPQSVHRSRGSAGATFGAQTGAGMICVNDCLVKMSGSEKEIVYSRNTKPYIRGGLSDIYGSNMAQKNALELWLISFMAKI